MEQPRIVPLISTVKELAEPEVHPGAFQKGLKPAVLLDTPIFADTEEDDPVDGALDGEVEISGGEVWVSEGDVSSEHIPPAFDLLEKSGIDFGCSSLTLARFDVLIEGAFEHRILGEYGGDLIPAVDVLFVGEIHGTRLRRSVRLHRLDTTIINCQLLKIGKDAQGKFGRPGIPSELEGWADIVFEVDRGFLGFDEELAGPPYTETIVWGLGRSTHLYGVFVDYVFVSLCIAFFVIHIPSKSFEKGIDELTPELGLVILA
jgi:hypothetical protein